LIESRLLSLLDIKYPIFQGGMAWVSRAELAASVSEAGALGIIGAGLMEPGDLEDEIEKTKKLTSRPFGVNLIVLAPHLMEKLEVVLKTGVRVLTVGAGNAGPILSHTKGKDVIVIPVVASVPLAVRMERAGAKAVIVEGYEAGGHIGELTTMALTAMVTKAVSIPVIAAGGIADGRGMAAAFALGAEGIQMGTAFTVAKECTVSDRWKKRVIDAKDRDTVVTGRSTGHPVRILKNRLSRDIIEMEKAGKSPEEIMKMGEGKLFMAVEGDVMEGSVMSGQIAGLVDEERGVRQIIDSVMSEAIDTIKGLNKIVK
jgi:enoyl-[acyl-carrier protein] reductase II